LSGPKDTSEGGIIVHCGKVNDVHYPFYFNGL